MITISENNLIKIGKEAMVLLPLKKWQAIEELLTEQEDLSRYNRAIAGNKKAVSFEKVKKQLNLP
ncbi:MAG: hypothetical protein Q7R99_02660 [bacterium]|nr:hypothetical protein [bacterium]